MEDCTICCETYNGKCKKVVCLHCSTHFCTKCCSVFLLDSVNDSRCMSCGKQWDREFMINSFGYSFVNTKYKHHLEKILFEREKSKFPETQVLLEEMKRIDEIKNQIEEIEEEITQRRFKITDLESDLNFLKYNKNSKKSVSFFGHCPNEGCEGFINSFWKCGLCDQKVCKSCKENIGNEKDAYKLHSCNPDTLASVRAMKGESKPCPKCKVPIFKINGCNMMWCTNCNVSFCWRTGEIHLRNIHNPHYFEWLNRTRGNNLENNGGNNLENNGCIEDIPATIRGIDERLSTLQRKNLINIIHLVRHVRHYTMTDIDNRIQRDNFQNYRIQYITKIDNIDSFKFKLQKEDKKKKKLNDQYQVFDMFYTCSSTYLREYIFIEKTNMVNTTFGYGRRNSPRHKVIVPENVDKFLVLIDDLINYTNDSMMKLCKTYKNKMPILHKDYVDNSLGRICNYSVY